MPFVKCSVGSCSRKLQPILKVDPRDRDTWFYRECEVCLKPACEEHSSGVDGRVIALIAASRFNAELWLE